MITKMKTKLVIFDWAGTTVDYGCFAPVHAFYLAFQAFGIAVTDQEIREPMGMLKRDHIRKMLQMDRISAQWKKAYNRCPTEEDVANIYVVFEESLLKSLAEYATPKPGAIEAIKCLHEKGIKVGSTTGYTDRMMETVVKAASAQGYAPDAWFSPDATSGLGRPYPYMIYKNMMQFHIESVNEVVKVGDTLSDIKEGKNAGVFSVGIIEGSSEMGMTESEYAALPKEEKEKRCIATKNRFTNAGADAVFPNLYAFVDWITKE